MKYKVITCVTTYNRCSYLKKFVNSWRSTKSNDFENILIIADDGSTDGTLKFISKIESKNIIAIRNNRAGISKQTNSLFRKSLSIGFDYAFKCDDDIWFKKYGWQELYIGAIVNSNYSHLCYHNKKWLNPKRDTVVKGPLRAQVSVLDCMGCFWSFTPNVLKKIGLFDERNFGFMGHEHIDFSMRCCRAGFNERINFFDADGSNEYIDMIYKNEGYVGSLRGSDSKMARVSHEDQKRRWAIIFNESRIKI